MAMIKYRAFYRPRNKKKAHLLRKEPFEATNDIECVKKVMRAFPELKQNRICIQKLALPVRIDTDVLIPEGDRLRGIEGGEPLSDPDEVVGELVSAPLPQAKEAEVMEKLTAYTGRPIVNMPTDDLVMIAKNAGGDFISELASRMFDIPMSEVTKQDRADTKKFAFGVLYGAGQERLQEIVNKAER